MSPINLNALNVRLETTKSYRVCSSTIWDNLNLASVSANQPTGSASQKASKCLASSVSLLSLATTCSSSSMRRWKVIAAGRMMINQKQCNACKPERWTTWVTCHTLTHAKSRQVALVILEITCRGWAWTWMCLDSFINISHTLCDRWLQLDSSLSLPSMSRLHKGEGGARMEAIRGHTFWLSDNQACDAAFVVEFLREHKRCVWRVWVVHYVAFITLEAKQTHTILSIIAININRINTNSFVWCLADFCWFQFILHRGMSLVVNCFSISAVQH